MLKAQDKIIVVSARLSGERLQNVLKKHLGEAYSGKRIKQIIDGYGCRVNGKIELFSSYKVHPGDKIQLSLHESSISVPQTVQVLYEDEDLLIWDKPAHTVSDVKTLQKLFSPKKIHLVHRLDKDTTGVMLLAKNIVMQKMLEELFKKREVHKTYHALTQGDTRQEAFTVENRLGKLSQYEGQAIWGSHPEGAYALTHFEVLKRNKGALLLQCNPVTGRTHQIRAHLAERGLPIFGDHHYAREKNFKYSVNRSLLHASSVEFIHPKKKITLTIRAPYPEDMRKALNELL